ncbi:MAG: hypothetical protein A3A43_01080 [Candidatus Liptonbacteria bacterium RIFCSPLOWO2_01_FULL_56_20]|uniref:Uncharacterized protein n=1 Tax=Candidatus Liptonbacteria bacterium RIFCSPLOWO2_01_FULL_56_20 TaxID=1798652 RepID=A0A1G2CKV8_9BACT|nr:MAG: hypothetical protein UY96_C0007G0001 [Parcubacteria group bacterium GW2011_GWB1_56_8]OGZ01370.1 MAG: hypothetical protein A3A43_01080 [Candidatus Liptonbacteria bacterium RIFCSPLOWO2_01_FULL_56_20]
MADTDKKRSRGFWNMLFSAADPELKKLADRIRGAIPEDSPLRSVFAERIIGVIKGWAEGKADNLSPIAGAVVEKLTDLGDFFVGGESSPKSGKVARDWMDQFVVEVGKRLKETKFEDLDAEKDKILKEFVLRRAILEEIKKTYEEAQPKRAEPGESINWSELRAKLYSMLEIADASVNNAVRDFRTSQRWIHRSKRRQRQLNLEITRSGARDADVTAPPPEQDDDPWHFEQDAEQERGGQS